jgi:arginine:agmatine antiporter
VPRATLLGIGLAAVVYVLATTAIMGIVPNGDLRLSSAPFADAATYVLGPIVGGVITVCAIAKSAGALGGWTLVVAEMGQAAAKDRMFPAIFTRQSRRGTPIAALLIVAALMSAVVLLVLSPTVGGLFTTLSDMSVLLVLPPYIYACNAVRHYLDGQPRAMAFTICAMLGAVFCLWVVLSSDTSNVVIALVLILTTVPLCSLAGSIVAPPAAPSAGD